MSLISYRTIKKIAETIDKNDYDYEYLALRCQSVYEEIGSTMTHKSSRWVDGEELDELLDGVSAINLRSAKWLPDEEYSGYLGSYLILLGSNYGHCGEDNGEIVLTNPVVLKIWKI